MVHWMTKNHSAKFQGLKMNFNAVVGAVYFGHFLSIYGMIATPPVWRELSEKSVDKCIRESV